MTQGSTKGVPIDTDPTLAANSNQLVCSQAAIKTYVDASVAAGDLPPTATANQVLLSQSLADPVWSTSTYPATNAINTLLYASSANVMSALATANSSVLVTSAGGVPSLSTALPPGLTATNMSLTTPTLGAATATSLTFSPTTGGIIGTTTNDNASAGTVGELISSSVLAASSISLTTATAANVTSISLTAGDWDVCGNVFISLSVLGSVARCWISSTSASAPDNSLLSFIGTVPATSTNSGMNAPNIRFSLSGTTTIYLSCSATFASGTGSASGNIIARRAR